MQIREDYIVKRRLKRFRSYLYFYRKRFASAIATFLVFTLLFAKPWKPEVTIDLSGAKIECVKGVKRAVVMQFTLPDMNKYRTAFNFNRCNSYISEISDKTIIGVQHGAGWGIVELKANSRIIYNTQGVVWFIILFWSFFTWLFGLAIIKHVTKSSTRKH